MTRASPLAKTFIIAVLAGFASLASNPAAAQQTQRGPNAESAPSGYPPAHYGPRKPGGVGGYSLTLSDIWGPAKMPPAPKDFGPHFDFPPEPLNGAPLHDPYPN
jgi:hypothetical protein